MVSGGANELAQSRPVAPSDLDRLGTRSRMSDCRHGASQETAAPVSSPFGSFCQALPSSAASKTYGKASVAFGPSLTPLYSGPSCGPSWIAICVRLPMLASRLFRRARSSFRLHRRLSSFFLRCLPLSIPAAFGFECSALISLNAGYLRNLKWFWIYGSRTLCRLLWPSVFVWLRYSSVKRSRTLALTPSRRGLAVMSASLPAKLSSSSTCSPLLIWPASATGSRLPACPNISLRVGSCSFSWPSCGCCTAFSRPPIHLCTYHLSAKMHPVTLHRGRAFPWLVACATFCRAFAYGSISGTSRCISIMCRVSLTLLRTA